MREKGFFNTFISVCSGTAVFPQIAQYSILRMAWHLILLAILGGCVNIAFRYHPFNIAYEAYCSKLQKRFGEISFSEKGITPTIHPEKNGTVRKDNLRVDYFQTMEELKTFQPDDESLFGIAWTPKSVVAWLLYDKKPYPFMPMLIPAVPDPAQVDKGMSFLFKSLKGDTEQHLSLYDVSNIYKIELTPENYTRIPFREFKTNIVGVPQSLPTIFMLFLFSEILINCLIISPVYVLIFTLFSYFLGKSEMLSLKFTKLLVVGIYTGFPGIVIATLYTALDLPYLDFQSVFLLAYLIYSFPVFTRLRMEQLKG